MACQAPLSMGFSRHKYWSGLPFPSPGDLPDPGMELMFLASPSVAGRFFTTKEFWEASGKPRTLYMDILEHRRCSISSAEWMNLPQHCTCEPHHIFLLSVERLANRSLTPNLHASHKAVIHIILRKPCF